MNKTLKLIMLLLAITMTKEYLLAQSPRVSMQGTLKDAKGASASDGKYQVVFKLYNTPTIGTALWTETDSITLSGGIYSHYLGSINPLNSADFANPLFLGINTGGIELTPRTELTYAPYAFAVQEVTCSGAVGDIKYSILNPTKFAEVNGSCWVPMDGRAIPGSKLKTIIGSNNVPDGSGLFLRMQEHFGGADNDPARTNTSPIATVQTSAIKPHGHSLTEIAHSHPYSDRVHEIIDEKTYAGIVNASPKVGDDDVTIVSETTSSATMGASVNNSGNTESRPKNINFWIYVRIN